MPTKPRTAGRQKGRKNIAPIDFIVLMRRVAVARNKPKPDSWAVIAKREGQAERTIRDMYARYQEEQDTLDDPLGIVQETLDLYTEAINRFSEESVVSDQGSVRIGALRSMLEAAKGRIELLAAVGRLPRRMRTYQDAQDVAAMIHEMVTVLQESDLDGATMRALLNIVDRRAHPEAVIDVPAIEASSGGD